MKRWVLISAIVTIISGIIGLVAYFSTSHFQLSSEYSKCDTYFEQLKKANKDDIVEQNAAFKRYKDCSEPLTDRYFRNSTILIYVYLVSLPIFLISLVTTVVLFKRSEENKQSL